MMYKEENKMARTNQGIFDKITKDNKSLNKDYQQAIEMYFPSGEWDNNYDFFSDFAYTADSIYNAAIELKGVIDGMLKSTKFEEEDNEQKYQTMKESVQDIEYEIKSKFNSVLDMIKRSGYISDVEQRTLDKLNIYR